ncbi:MAG: hypothetical protein Kow0089_03120 [Desulfobulbaceae bacterium]
MQPVLQLRGVSHRYNGRVVLDIPELDLGPGSITGLAGPNGSGKSTLLTILGLVEQCAAGTVFFKGSPAAPFAPEAHRRIALLPQEPYLLRRSVYENIAYGLRIRGERDNLGEKVNRALELVGLDHGFAARAWHELSGGEARRVALAARLAVRPDCLLLDEPTTGVDMESGRFIRRAVLDARREWGTTLVVASHHRSWLEGVCDRILFLYQGRILDSSYDNVLTGPWETTSDGTAACVLSDGQRVYAAGFPGPGRGALLPPTALKLLPGPPADSTPFLRGTVMKLATARHGHGAEAGVLCGDQQFLVSLSAASLRAMNLLPGARVCLAYDPAEVTWLAS